MHGVRLQVNGYHKRQEWWQYVLLLQARGQHAWLSSSKPHLLKALAMVLRLCNVLLHLPQPTRTCATSCSCLYINLLEVTYNPANGLALCCQLWGHKLAAETMQIMLIPIAHISGKWSDQILVQCPAKQANDSPLEGEGIFTSFSLPEQNSLFLLR